MSESGGHDPGRRERGRHAARGEDRHERLADPERL